MTTDSDEHLAIRSRVGSEYMKGISIRFIPAIVVLFSAPLWPEKLQALWYLSVIISGVFVVFLCERFKNARLARP
jgi:hypothetical protein